MQYDFASENPVYRIIYKTPVSKTYIVMDMGEQLAASPSAIAAMMPDTEKIALIQEKVITLYKDNAVVSKKSGGYRIKIGDEGFKNICSGLFGITAELMNEQLLKMSMTESEMTEINARLTQFKDGFEAIKDKLVIFGKDGFTIDMNVNSAGYITGSKTSAHISLNVYDIMTAFGAEDMCSEAGITKENSCIDFTLEETEKYLKINQNVKVEYPVLTEENSYNPMAESEYYGGDYAEPEYEETTYAEEVLSPYFWVEYEELPVVKDNVVYIPLYPLLGEFNVGTEEISISGGEITVQSDNSYIFSSLKLYENSVLAEKDGEKILIDNPVINIDGNYWVGTDYAQKVLSSELEDVYFSYYGTSYSFNREIK